MGAKTSLVEQNRGLNMRKRTPGARLHVSLERSRFALIHEVDRVRYSSGTVVEPGDRPAAIVCADAALNTRSALRFHPRLLQVAHGSPLTVPRHAEHLRRR